MNPTRYILMSGQDFHCWKLVEKVYEGELDIVLQDFDSICSTQSGVPSHLAEFDERWSEVKRLEWTLVDEPQLFDVVEMHSINLPHTGVYIGGGRMLHKAGAQITVQQILTEDNWKRRILGFYRHSSMM